MDACQKSPGDLSLFLPKKKGNRTNQASMYPTHASAEQITSLRAIPTLHTHKAKLLPKRSPMGIKRSCLFTTQSNTKASPFPSLRLHSKHESTNIKRKPNCVPGGTLSKTRLASCSGGILASSTNTGEPLRLDTGRIYGRIHRQGILSGILGGSTGKLLWDTQRDTRRDLLAGCFGGILGGIH